MEGQNAFEFSFRKKDQIETLRQKTLVNGEKVALDPQLLFQRLIIIANNSELTMEEIFKYELCNHPTSLFDKHGLLREATKSHLADALFSTVQMNMTGGDKPPDFQVLDGGSLLHRIQWKKGTTFDDIVNTYVKHVTDHCIAANVTVVFDGYRNSHSTKDMTHQRRSKGKVGPRIHFMPTMLLKSKKNFSGK